MEFNILINNLKNIQYKNLWRLFLAKILVSTAMEAKMKKLNRH